MTVRRSVPGPVVPGLDILVGLTATPLALVHSGYEAGTSVSNWRHPSDAGARFSRHTVTPSMVEKLVTSQRIETSFESAYHFDAQSHDPADAA